jgi:tight adherence protein B
VLTAAPFAGAKTRPHLTEAAGATFPDRAFVVSLPSDRSLQANQVDVRENDQRVTGLSLDPAGGAAGDEFGVVLAIDASDSMEGKPIAGALQAAQLFVTRKARNQQVAIVTFNSKAEVLLPFTSDAGKILQALSRPPTLAYGTHIYDAVSKSISLLQEAKIAAGSVVVLSDGADTGSEATRSQVAAAAARSHVRVFTVGLPSKRFDQSALRKLAASASGNYSEATSVQALAQIYDELGSRLAHEYLLRYRSFAGLGQKVQVTVRVQGIPTTFRSGYATPTIASGAVATGYHHGFGTGFWDSAFTMLVFGAVVIGLLAGCLFLLFRPRHRSVQNRVAEFVSLADPSDGAKLGSALPDRFIVSTEQSLEGSRWWKRFVEEVELAEIKMKPAYIALWTLFVTVALMWLFAVVFTFAGLVLALIVPFIVWGAIRRLVERKRSLFAEQLPDNLAVLASALRAGHSFVGALSVVVEDAPEPAQSEFRRVVADERLGVQLENALEVVARRMNSEDLKQVGLVAVLQRESGGSTAEVLERVVDTVRERQELRRLVRTLTAAGRMSRWVVSGLPLVLIGAIALLNPGYLKPLFEHTSGRVMVVFAALLVISGSYVIKRIVDIKV